MSNEVVVRVSAIIDGFDARVRAAAPDRWSHAAPCDGWTARDVVVHVGNNLLRLGGALQAGEGAAAGWVAGAKDGHSQRLSGCRRARTP